MVDKKSVTGNAPAILAATGGFITAIVGLLSFMSSPAPSIVSFDASPNIISIGESSILKWSVTGEGATVDIEPDIGSVGLLGTREVAPSISTNYTLTAKNKDQEKIASVLLIVKEKNEGNPVNDNAPSGIAAEYDVEMPKDVKTEQDQQQNPIYATLPSATGTGNPDETAIVPDSDLQQNAGVPPAQMAEVQNFSESTAIDQSAIEQNTAQEATTHESNDPESIAHIESGMTEPSMMNETDTISTYNNESCLGANSGLGTGSGNDGATEPTAAKTITAADWDYLKNVSSSENNFANNAPIYAKLEGMNHASPNNPDLQDPAVSDLGIEGPDYISTDIGNQASSMMHTP